MFTFILQLIDLAKVHHVGLFLVFFILVWIVFAVKIAVMLLRKPLQNVLAFDKFAGTISVIIPVTDEPYGVWKDTLTLLKDSLHLLNVSEVIVVANGHNGKENIKLAEKFGFTVVRLPEASKRMAVAEGVKLVTSDVTVILDSDTHVLVDSIQQLVRVFNDKTVGGATPHHIIKDRESNYVRRVCDWLEDIRFNEVVKGQSSYGAVSCLPGRLLAIKTSKLKEYADGLVNQRFLGRDCISGDDRYLTSELLQDGLKTVYVPQSIVYTEAPDTLKKFSQQRLRWSRTSFRETLRSLSWTFNYPFTAFTVVANVVMRWFFFVVIVLALGEWFGLIERPHALDLPLWFILVLTAFGWLVSGLLRQLRHIIKYPQDLVYLPVFLFVTTFVLTPIEWFGNVTIRESNWMTRRVK